MSPIQQRMPCQSQRDAGAPSRLGRFVEPGAAKIMHSWVLACPAQSECSCLLLACGHDAVGCPRFLWKHPAVTLCFGLHGFSSYPSKAISCAFPLRGTSGEPGSSLCHAQPRAGGCCASNTDPIPTHTLDKGGVSGNIC